MNEHVARGAMAGTTLLEVLLGIAVFVIGMLALAAMQSNLARSSADSNARTAATNIAEEIIEQARNFRVIDAVGDGSGFGDIVGGSQTISRGGYDFEITRTVNDFYYTDNSSDYSTTKAAGVVYPDFKTLQVDVTWNPSQAFLVGDGETTDDTLGSGSITMTEVISSIPALSSIAVATTGGDIVFEAPTPDYTPASSPEAVPVVLGNSRYREVNPFSQSINRKTNLTETRFDVVTYQQAGSDTTFLRREEFLTVACNCELHAADVDLDSSRRPTVWDGFEYTDGELVSKPYGESTESTQSIYCPRCCRDHHDGGSGENDQDADPGRALYNPFRPSTEYFDSGTFSGDHKHYSRAADGAFVLADSDGDPYVEICRMIRNDGFFRVAQDFRQEGLFAFPEDYLASSSGVNEYGGYVADAVAAFESAIGATDQYEASPPTLMDPADATPAITFPASSASNPTTLPLNESDSQQLESRGIYIDYMSDDLRVVINCLELGGTAETCGAESALSAIEVIPFLDIRLTRLSRWNESPANYPVNVTNEPPNSDGSHSRGLATLQTDATGESTVTTQIGTRNRGITNTDPIDPEDLSSSDSYALYINGPEGPSAAVPALVVSGSLSDNVVGMEMSDVIVTGSLGVQCGSTDTTWTCEVSSGASDPTVTFSNYAKNIAGNAYGCSTAMTTSVSASSYTTFNLPGSSTSSANVYFQKTNC